MITKDVFIQLPHGGIQKPVEVVYGVIKANGKIFTMFNYKKQFLQFPGGKQDPGELPEQTLKRELEEELGITEIFAKELGVFFTHTLDCEPHEYKKFTAFEVYDWSKTITNVEHKKHGRLKFRTRKEALDVRPHDDVTDKILNAVYELADL
jgi:8-oxo-dGTP pyrophosphatase MutT (NUDIX family)